MTKQQGIEALADCRRRIDSLDARLIELLNDRTAIVEQIGRIKRDLDLPIYEPRREDQVYSNVLAHNHGPLDHDAVRRIFERIIDEMRQLQRLRMTNGQ